MPQAARVALPPLANSFIALVKDTSLAAVLTVPEIFQAAQRIASVTYEPLILYTEAALIYLVFSSVLSSAQVRLERKFGRHALFQCGQLMIRLEKIDKSFGEHRVLNSVDLQLAPGNVTALIGPSGSGKSTLLRCVNLLEIPEAGSLKLGDQRIEFSRTDKPSRDAVLDDTPPHRHGVPELSVVSAPDGDRQNVMEGWSPCRSGTRSKRAYEQTNCWRRSASRRRPMHGLSTLSGGQQQRVAIARALAPSPEVLLCDEPTSALDPGLAAEVVDVLKQLAKEGMTMLMATHDLRLAASIARDVVFLSNGVVVEAGPSRDIFMQPRAAGNRAFRVDADAQPAGRVDRARLT